MTMILLPVQNLLDCHLKDHFVTTLCNIHSTAYKMHFCTGFCFLITRVSKDAPKLTNSTTVLSVSFYTKKHAVSFLCYCICCFCHFLHAVWLHYILLQLQLKHLRHFKQIVQKLVCWLRIWCFTKSLCYHAIHGRLLLGFIINATFV